MKWLDKLIEKRVDRLEREIYQLEERRDNYQEEFDREMREVLEFNELSYSYTVMLATTVVALQREIDKKKEKIRFVNQLFFIKGKSNDD